jgi:predicted metal-dependent enzyme (double-stranded beta helix superfamily)
MYRLQLVLLTLFCLTASADQHGDGPPNPCHMYYPNIPGELLLENDKLVVQRFIIEPGQWEGIHRHPPDQLYIHVKGGQWTVKYGDEATTSVDPDGSIGWSDTATEMSAMHESGNTGDEPIDLIWVTLKPGCMAPPADEK